MVWDSKKVPSPKESMHSELLMHLERRDIDVSDRNAHPHFEIAAWLELKNTDQLPSMLLIEYIDRNGEHWEIIDSVTIRSKKETILLSGISEPEINYLKEVNVYLCHPTPFIECSIEELRFNDQIVKSDYLDNFNVA